MKRVGFARTEITSWGKAFAACALLACALGLLLAMAGGRPAYAAEGEEAFFTFTDLATGQEVSELSTTGSYRVTCSSDAFDLNKQSEIFLHEENGTGTTVAIALDPDPDDPLHAGTFSGIYRADGDWSSDNAVPTGLYEVLYGQGVYTDTQSPTLVTVKSRGGYGAMPGGFFSYGPSGDDYVYGNGVFMMPSASGASQRYYEDALAAFSEDDWNTLPSVYGDEKLHIEAYLGVPEEAQPVLKKIVFYRFDGSVDDVEVASSDTWPTGGEFADKAKRKVVWSEGDGNLDSSDFVLAGSVYDKVVIDGLDLSNVALAEGVYYPMLVFQMNNTYKAISNSQIYNGPQTQTICYNPFEFVAQGSPAATAPRILTAKLPAATAGQGYSATLAGASGAPEQGAFTWEIIDGALPEGIALDGETGALTGTPTQGGKFSFTVRLTEETAEGSLSAERSYVLNVEDELSLGEVECEPDLVYAPCYIRVRIPVSVNMSEAGFTKSTAGARIVYEGTSGTELYYPFYKTDDVEQYPYISLSRHDTYFEGYLPTPSEYDLLRTDGVECPMAIKRIEYDVRLVADEGGLQKSFTDFVDASHINVAGTLAFDTPRASGYDRPGWSRYDETRIKLWRVDDTGARIGKVITRRFAYTSSESGLAASTAISVASGTYRFTIEGSKSGEWMDALVGADASATRVEGLPAGSNAQYQVNVEPGWSVYVSPSETSDKANWLREHDGKTHLGVELNEPPTVTCTADVRAEGLGWGQRLLRSDYDVSWYRVDAQTAKRMLVATGAEVEVLSPAQNIVAVVEPRESLAATYDSAGAALEAYGGFDEASVSVTLPKKPAFTVSGSVSCTNGNGAWQPGGDGWKGSSWGSIELRKPTVSGKYVSETIWLRGTSFQFSDVTAGSVLVYSPPAASACGQVSYAVPADANADISGVELSASAEKGVLGFGAITYTPALEAGSTDVAQPQQIALDSSALAMSVKTTRSGEQVSVPFHVVDGNLLVLEADDEGSYDYLADDVVTIDLSYAVPGQQGLVVGKALPLNVGALNASNGYSLDVGDVSLAAGGHASVSYANEGELPVRIVVYDAEGALVGGAASQVIAAKSGIFELPFMDAGSYDAYFVQADFLDSLETATDEQAGGASESDYATKAQLESALDAIAAEDGGRAAFAVSEHFAIAEGTTSALHVRFPIGGQSGPVDRMASSVQMASSYSSSVTVDVTVRLKEGQQLKHPNSAKLQISTNQTPVVAQGGMVNIQALSFNGKVNDIDRFKASSVNSYEDLAMASGGVTFNLAGLDDASMRSFPLTCSMVIPRTDFETLRARAWIVDGDGKRYSIGEFERRTDEVTLKAQSIVTKKSFNVSGRTAGGADVKVLLDGMQVASAQADKHGYYTAPVTLPDAVNDGTTVNLSATARYTVGEGSEAREATASSKSVPVLFDTRKNSVKRVTMYWQYIESSTELESMVVWEDGAPAAMYKSFYRGWDDRAVIFWTVELENPYADDENIFVKVPRNDGDVLLHAAKGLFDSANLADDDEGNDPSWARYGLPYLQWAKENISEDVYICEPHYFAGSAPSNVSVIFGEQFSANEVADATLVEVNDRIAPAFAAADESAFADSIDAANANEEATMYFVESADAAGDLDVPDGADIAAAVKQNSSFSVALKNDAGDAWLPVEMSTKLQDMTADEMRAEAEGLVEAARGVPVMGDGTTWQGSDDVARNVTAAVMGDMTPANTDDRYLVETTDENGAAGIDSMSYYADEAGNGVYRRDELDNQRLVRTEYNLSKGQKSIMVLRIGKEAVQAGASLADSTAVWDVVLERLGDGLLEADKAYGDALAAGGGPSGAKANGTPLKAARKASKAKDKLPKPDKAKAWADDVKKREAYKKEDRMTCDEARMLKDFMDANKGTCLWYEAGNNSGDTTSGVFFDIDQQCTVPILERIGEYVSKITGGAKDGPGGVVGAAGDEVKGAIKGKAKEQVFGTKHSKQFEDYLLKLWYMGQSADIANGSANGNTGFHKRVDWDKYPMAELVAMLARQEEENKPEEPNTQAETDEYPKGQYDPSGYVYEAVESNRVEGATVRLYTFDGQSGSTVFADPSEFGIDPNPQITAADGRYQWYVPEGYWQVQVSKPGYATASTGSSSSYGLNATKELNIGEQILQADSYWMPVLPVQLDVNIGLVSYEAPSFTTQVNDDATAVTVTFSKYVRVDSVTASMFAVNDVAVTQLVALDAEPSASDGETMLASRFELAVPEGAVSLGRGANAVVTTFANDAEHPVTSYAGTPVAPGTVKSRSVVEVDDVAAIDLSGAQVRTAEDAYTYTGAAIRPRLVVTLDGATLRSGRDFTVTFENNVEVGQARATIAGTGAYEGSASTSFTIKAPDVAAVTETLERAQQQLAKVVASEDGVTAADGSKLKAGALWASSAAIDELEAAIAQARDVLAKQTATKSEVAAAMRALMNAVAAIHKAKGSSDEGQEGQDKPTPAPAAQVKVDASYAAGSGASAGTYQVKTLASKGKTGTVWFKKPKASKKKLTSVVVPSTVSIKGAKYKVVGIAPKALYKFAKLKKATIGANVKTVGKNAFKGCKKLKTMTVQTKLLTKASCKNLVKGSKVQTIKLKGAAKKAKKAYKKRFPKKNAGKKLKVR